MSDVTLYCIDCNQPFEFTAREQQFFASKNIVNPPERCKSCREQHKQDRQNNRPTDQILNCADCNQSFVFTGGEQKFYQKKGMSAPTRCKTCREQRKQERQNNTSANAQPGQPRQMYDATCAACGNNTRVPFQPKPGRSVYCRNCYQAQKPVR